MTYHIMLAIDTTAIADTIILGIAAFVRSTVCFGDGLIAMGLMTGWVALIRTAISSSILATQWQQVDIKIALPLIVSTQWCIHRNDTYQLKFALFLNL